MRSTFQDYQIPNYVVQISKRLLIMKVAALPDFARTMSSYEAAYQVVKEYGHVLTAMEVMFFY